MIVVSDTSPLSNLLRIGQISLLKAMYGQVIIPQRVYEELSLLPTFGVDLTPLQSADWIKVSPAQDQARVETLCSELDPGEAEAIVLAIELKADRLLIDERIGRQVAQRYGRVSTQVRASNLTF